VVELQLKKIECRLNVCTAPARLGVTQISGCGDGGAGAACSSLDAEGVAAGCTADETLLLVSTEDPARVLSLDWASGLLRKPPLGSADESSLPRQQYGAQLSGGEAVWGAGTLSEMRRNKMLESLSCGSDDAHRHLLFTGMEDPPKADGEIRVISDCHFRKTATEYDSKPGIKWLSCTEK
jgi:hypothetical protein